MAERSGTVHADAPGRVNLIGEHTDYNGGLVLPTAIPQRTAVDLTPRTDARVRVESATVAPGKPVEFTLGAERRDGSWLDYVAGCTAVLRADGHPLRGFDARIASDVPVGSGLSSSAALTVAVLRALRAAFALALDDVALALAAHRAEHDFVGVRVGVMDQMASSLADERSALFLDTRSLVHERIPVPPVVRFAVIDSGVPHENATGGYQQRRAECEAACARLGIRQLRDLGVTDLPRLAALPETLARRARHVVTEDARVDAAVAALRAADLVTLGRLFHESHVSQRDDYEVSVPEVDLLVELASGEPGVHGARLTGGGFGGSIVVAADAGASRAAADRAVAEYRRRTGRDGRVLVA